MKLFKQSFRTTSLVIALLFSPVVISAPADITTQAKALLKAGQSAEAYALVSAHHELVDDPEFDYVYGISALDAGHPGVAVFAFERVLAQQPQHFFARAELGRALYQLGETRDALREFRTLRAMKPPAAVLERLLAYEAALQQGEARAYQLRGFVEAFFGYDSNYNSATSASDVAIPAFGNLVFTLDDLFTENESATGGLRGNGQLLVPISERSTFVANLGLDGAGFTNADDGYFYINLNGSIGVHHRYDADDSFSVSVNGFSTWVGDLDYLHAIGGTGTWRHEFTVQDSIETFVRIASLSYDDVIDYRDVRQYLGGTNYVRSNGERWTLGIGAFGGLEDERDDARPDVGRDLYGGRVFGTYQFNERTRFSAEVVGQFSDYHGIDNLFQTVRDDELVRAVVAVRYQLPGQWSVRPELRYTNNHSNIPTSDYERFEGLVFVRREFD